MPATNSPLLQAYQGKSKIYRHLQTEIRASHKERILENSCELANQSPEKGKIRALKKNEIELSTAIEALKLDYSLFLNE
jgi:hypothetical protein